MAHDVDSPAAAADAALLKLKSADTHRKGGDSPRQSGSAEGSPEPPDRKTSIEVAFDMSRATEGRSKTRVSPPPRPVVQAAAEPQSAAVTSAVGRWEQNQSQELPVHATAQPSQPRPREWSSRYRRVHVAALAGAALALLIGAGLGYVAGKGDPAVARASVESLHGGMKLRLDPDLQHR